MFRLIASFWIGEWNTLYVHLKRTLKIWRHKSGSTLSNWFINSWFLTGIHVGRMEFDWWYKVYFTLGESVYNLTGCGTLKYYRVSRGITLLVDKMEIVQNVFFFQCNQHQPHKKLLKKKFWKLLTFFFNGINALTRTFKNLSNLNNYHFPFF